MTDFIPQCLEAGFTQGDVSQMTVVNPANAFAASIKISQ
jgi:predicted metal-dependent phosphotriesterase family hydrolase